MIQRLIRLETMVKQKQRRYEDIMLRYRQQAEYEYSEYSRTVRKMQGKLRKRQYSITKRYDSILNEIKMETSGQMFRNDNQRAELNPSLLFNPNNTSTSQAVSCNVLNLSVNMSDVMRRFDQEERPKDNSHNVPLENSPFNENLREERPTEKMLTNSRQILFSKDSFQEIREKQDAALQTSRQKSLFHEEKNYPSGQLTASEMFSPKIPSTSASTKPFPSLKLSSYRLDCFKQSIHQSQISRDNTTMDWSSQTQSTKRKPIFLDDVVSFGRKELSVLYEKCLIILLGQQKQFLACEGYTNKGKEVFDSFSNPGLLI
eukprot:TRINITY_DN11752_c0_g1_i2.p1 TRINITY_DN11752_c0_g1~~TRINITY_DN11752_c0_g1_i2.p1  ORF type:complete len:316 (-),score=44.40 TRINITY_DN11752_c0_g1_i2:155-1102(-)